MKQLTTEVNRSDEDSETSPADEILMAQVEALDKENEKEKTV